MQSSVMVCINWSICDVVAEVLASVGLPDSWPARGDRPAGEPVLRAPSQR